MSANYQPGGFRFTPYLAREGTPQSSRDCRHPINCENPMRKENRALDQPQMTATGRPLLRATHRFLVSGEHPSQEPTA
jgi:hypothetical protein